MAVSGEDKDGPEILDPFQLSFSDLLFSSSPFQSSSDCKRISRNVMEALGPTGPGLLCVTGVLGSALLRRQLLPMARKLALLDPDKRNRILKEHHLGSDVPLKNPERDVSSFAMQLNNEQSAKPFIGKPCDEAAFGIGGKQDLQEGDDEFKNLGAAFKELGFCMRELGLLIARVCDREIGGGLLEESLLESSTAKGRLIHYHSAADKCLLAEAERGKPSGKRVSCKKGDQNGAKKEVNHHRNGPGLSRSHFNLWQQWHYDYGIFTVLTDPMFLSSSHQECSLISTHSYMRIFHPSKNKFYMVKTPQDSFIVQIGESADILSKGKLRSTLHCVCRPEELEHVSRETFVVFLQPKWSQTFSVSEDTMEHLRSDCRQRQHPDTDDAFQAGIQRIVPPLSSRVRDGMTFAEFSRETTKQYYGGSGLQSNNR